MAMMWNRRVTAGATPASRSLRAAETNDGGCQARAALQMVSAVRTQRPRHGGEGTIGDGDRQGGCGGPDLVIAAGNAAGVHQGAAHYEPPDPACESPPAACGAAVVVTTSDGVPESEPAVEVAGDVAVAELGVSAA